MKNKLQKIQIPARSVLAVLIMVAGIAVSTRADAVSDWNAIAQQATITAGALRPGPSGVIDVAMVHAAIYDAVQAIEGKYEPYYVDIPNASGSSVAAAAKAARDILVNRFPGQAATLDITYQNYLTSHGIPLDDPGVTVGARSAAGIIALRACDGAFPNPPPPPFIGGLGIGVWRPTPPANSPMNPGPWLGSVTPFLLTRPSQFRSDPPPELTSRRYTRDYREVMALGSLNSTERTPEQTDLARFWAGNFGVMLNELVRNLADEHVDNLADSSRLFALTSMAQADSIIAVWSDKAHYVYWRPITAIQNGDLDGNSRTDGDPAWVALIATPPYPDYTSGANGITSATMYSLKNFFKRDHIDFTVTTTNTGPTNEDTREFKRFTDAAQEVVDARIYLGIHFRFADEAARTLGRRVADWGSRNYFRPTGHHHDDDAVEALH